jgi:putative ABC transport system permease protein
VSSIIQDLRYALRILRRNPGVTTVAILSLALGIGANSTVFSVVDALIFRPLPVQEPSELVTIGTHSPKDPDFQDTSYLNYLEIESQVPAFSGVAAAGFRGSFLSGHGPGEEISVAVVSENYFMVLGVNAALGRTFSPRPEAATGEAQSVVVSHRLWQRYFGGDPSLPGKRVLIDGKDFTVIGVAPREFEGLSKWSTTDIWVTLSGWYVMVPMEKQYQTRGNRWFEVYGRLKPGAHLEQARMQLQVLSNRLAQTYAVSNAGVTFSAASTAGAEIDDLKFGLLMMAMVGMVLLISCANVANLLLAQTERQQREIALRAAIGAGRWRLARLLLAESLLLALVGEALALLLASWMISALPAILPMFSGQLGTLLHLDARVVLFTTAISLATAVIFSLAPGLRLGKLQVFSILKGESSQGGGSALGPSLRNVMVAGEIGLCVILLVGSGLLLRTLLFSQNIKPGFDTHKNVLMFSVAPPGLYGYNEAQTTALLQSFLEHIETVPGVVRVSYARRPPLANFEAGERVRLRVPGVGMKEDLQVRYNMASPGFFATVGTRLLKGRDFSRLDVPTSQPVIIVNEVLARRFWPDGDAVGRSVRLDDRDYQIIGVVESGKYLSLRQAPEPYLYFSTVQKFSGEWWLFVETAQDPKRLIQTIVKEVQTVDRKLPLVGAITIADYVRQGLAQERSIAALLTGLSVLGMFLAAVGLYGVVAYLVSRRTHEIGIRMAMGARRDDVLKLVICRGIRLALLGAAAGCLVAYGAARVMADLLFGVKPDDPLTYLGSVALAISMALVASYVPARRATQVDPLVALRHE